MESILPFPRCLQQPLSFFKTSLILFGFVSFVTTIIDQSQLQGQDFLCQINIISPIRLNFKLHAIFFERGSRGQVLLAG